MPSALGAPVLARWDGLLGVPLDPGAVSCNPSLQWARSYLVQDWWSSTARTSAPNGQASCRRACWPQQLANTRRCRFRSGCKADTGRAPQCTVHRLPPGYTEGKSGCAASDASTPPRVRAFKARNPILATTSTPGPHDPCPRGLGSEFGPSLGVPSGQPRRASAPRQGRIPLSSPHASRLWEAS